MEGVVQKIYADSGKGRNGKPWTRYTLLVDGQRVNAGFTKPKCAEGDAVEFEAEEDQYGLALTEGSLKVTEKAEPKVPSRNAPASSSKSSGNGWNDPERTSRIERQSARRDAIDLVKLGVEAGLLEPKDYKDLQKYVQKQAEQFYEGLMGAATPVAPPPPNEPEGVTEAPPAASKTKPRKPPSRPASPSSAQDDDHDDDTPW